MYYMYGVHYTSKQASKQLSLTAGLQACEMRQILRGG